MCVDSNKNSLNCEIYSRDRLVGARGLAPGIGLLFPLPQYFRILSHGQRMLVEPRPPSPRATLHLHQVCGAQTLGHFQRLLLPRMQYQDIIVSVNGGIGTIKVMAPLRIIRSSGTESWDSS